MVGTVGVVVVLLECDFRKLRVVHQHLALRRRDEESLT